MAKGGGKSSASSGTRKKHTARKTGKDEVFVAELPSKKVKGKKGKRNQEPRKKVYIPPFKPPPAQQDPLDALGLAHQLPADLLVVLRKFSKRDTVTKAKALEEFQTGWVDRASKKEEDSALLEILRSTLPVWLHHVPVLFLHPSRRIRSLAVAVHASLLRPPGLHDQLIFHLREVASTDQAENLLGSWCMATCDVDRQTALLARRSWAEHVSLVASTDKLVVQGPLLAPLLSFVQRATLDPAGLYLYLNPVQVAVDVAPVKTIRGRPVPVLAKKPEEDAGPRARADGEEESETDRRARLRVGGIGVLQLILDTRAGGEGPKSFDDLLETLSNPALWSSLYPADACPFVDIESFGSGQPTVRTAAWSLILTLVQKWKPEMESLVPLLSAAILRSAFVDPDTKVRAAMLRPWLTFLREFPRAWDLEASFDLDKADEDENLSDSDSEDEGGDRPQASAVAGPSNVVSNPKQSRAYAEFLQFLELGCAGEPLNGYPTVLIILSTIPSHILTQADASSPSSYPAAAFFTSFWAAIDGRALSGLNRPATSAAFLGSLLECTTFIVRRIRNRAHVPGQASPLLGDEVNIENAQRTLVDKQYRMTWEEVIEGRLKVEPTVVGQLVAKNMSVLGEIDQGLFDTAWDTFAPSMTARIKTSASSTGQTIFSLLKAFRATFPVDSRHRSVADVLFRQISESVIVRGRKCLESEEDAANDVSSQLILSILVGLIDTFGDSIFEDSHLTEILDATVQQSTAKLLRVQPSLVTTYLARRGEQEQTGTLWRSALSSVSADLYVVLPPLVDAAERAILPDYLAPSDRELDGSISELFTDAMGLQNPASLPLLLRVVKTSKHFVTSESLTTLLHLIVAEVADECWGVSKGSDQHNILDGLLDLAVTCFDNHPELFFEEKLSHSLLPNVFSLAYLLSQLQDMATAHCVATAQRLWISWVKGAPTALKSQIGESVVDQLKRAIYDIAIQPASHEVLQAVTDGGLSSIVQNVDDVLPDRTRLEEILGGLRADPVHPSLAILQPLVPPASSFDSAEGPDCPADQYGLSPYARAVCALLHAYISNRETAKYNLWALRHILALGVYADELLQVPSLPSPVFYSAVSKQFLADITSRGQQLATYLLVIPQDDKWHSNVVSLALDTKSRVSSNDTASFVADLIKVAQVEDTYLDSRVMLGVLQHLLSDTNKEEADQWMVLARKLEKKAPQLSLAVTLAVNQFGPEPARLERYRNELAAEALGIPASKVNTSGLLLLRRLTATAPDPDSDVVFLPQPRAVNFMKACQQWIASDEDLDGDVESEMTSVFFYMIPILQNVSGSHWDLIFDVIESNLENSSFEDDEALTILWRTIRLIEVIQDLITYNKALRAQWQERQTTILNLLRDLVALQTRSNFSVPRSVCHEAALSVMQSMPSSLIDHETLPKMVHLLFDSSPNVQKMGYGLMREAAKKYTEHLVIEAGVDTESLVKPRLPLELVSFLQQSFEVLDHDEVTGSGFLGPLLGWMSVFDLYSNASMKVRSGYTDHLRDLDIIGGHFVPMMLNLLELYGGMSRSFKLDVWSVDDFYLELYDPDDVLSVRLFAAHLYYRALLTTSSLVRAWLTDCKDRTLTATVSNYTSTYFSPVIIRAEFIHVKSPEAIEELSVENLSVKVLPAVNEVTAAYTVDEQRLEVTLKIPNDWPLRGIEVKDSKRVGVSMEKWRGWLLGVQQIVSTQNGHIVDAISLFKKNVTAHFDGMVECAICYSIISVVEGDLPRKACKTCKNGFHASCLYKWFNTSHSSTCPLCRSEFM